MGSLDKMKETLAIFFFFFIVTESSAALYFHSGLELLHKGQEWNMYFKKQNADFHEVTYFQAYISGVASTARERLNLPQGVRVDQMCAIVFRYLQDNPERLRCNRSSPPRF
jgi:hypothetical protein